MSQPSDFPPGVSRRDIDEAAGEKARVVDYGQTVELNFDSGQRVVIGINEALALRASLDLAGEDIRADRDEWEAEQRGNEGLADWKYIAHHRTRLIDQFAMAALTGLLAAHAGPDVAIPHPEAAAQRAYDYAFQMMGQHCDSDEMGSRKNEP
jgi:hypothetical protein